MANWNEPEEEKAERLARKEQRKLERDMSKNVENAVRSVPPPTVDNSELRQILSRSPDRREVFAAKTGATLRYLQRQAQGAIVVHAQQREQTYVPSRLESGNPERWTGGNSDLWAREREMVEGPPREYNVYTPGGGRHTSRVPGSSRDIQTTPANVTPRDIEINRNVVQDPETGRLVPTYRREEFTGARRTFAPTPANTASRDAYIEYARQRGTVEGSGIASEIRTDPARQQQAIMAAIPGLASQITPQRAAEAVGYVHPSFGVRRETAGGYQWVGGEGEINISTEQFRKGMGWAQSAVGRLTGSQYRPSQSPRTMIYDMLQRARDAINEFAKGELEAWEKAVGDLKDDPMARAEKQREITATRQVAYRTLNETMGAMAGEITGERYLSGAADAPRFSRARLMQVAEAFGPEAASAVQSAFGQAGGGGGSVDIGGMRFNFMGDRGGRGGFGGRRGGFWGGMGNLGQVLYASYIAKRFWGYTGQPVIQAMQGYQQWMGDITGGAGVGAGYSMLVAANAQLARGRQAYNMFGPLMQAPADILGQYEPLGNLVSVGQVSAGLGIGAMALRSPFIHQIVPGMSGAAMGAVSGAMGLGASALMGAQLGFEGSRILFPERTRGLTWPKIAVAGLGSLGSILGAAGILRNQQSQGQVSNWIQSQEWFQNMALSAAESPFVAGREGLFREMSQSIGLPSDDAQLKSYIQNYEAVIGKRIEEGSPEAQQLARIVRQARAHGQDPLHAITQGANFASALGYIPGQVGFRENIESFVQLEPGQQQIVSEEQSRISGRRGMFAQLAPTPTDLSAPGALEASERAHQWTFEQAHQYASDWLAQRGYQGATLGMQMGMGYERAGRFGYGLSTYSYTQQQQAMAGVAAYVPEITMGGPGQAMLAQVMAPAFARMTPGQTRLMQAVTSGDVGAASYAARQGYLPDYYQFTDVGGRDLYQTDYIGWLNTLQGQMGAGVAFQGMPGMAYSDAFGGYTLTDVDRVKGFLGAETPDWLANALAEGGMIEAQREARERQYQRQMAGIGLQYQGVAARQEYLWGGGQYTGTPQAGSLWALQDVLRGAQYGAAMAGFGETRQQMGMANIFAMRGEALQEQRMDLSQDYQRWGLGFQREGMMLNQMWRREDWAYQDTMRGLQTQWSMEDIDEAIRMSTGRERRTLIRQKERMTTTRNLEGQQIERVRDRQEQAWAREEEAFEKKLEYTEEIMDLDREQFDLAVEKREAFYEFEKDNLARRLKEYQQQHAIQSTIIEKQRKFQAEELERQKQALGLQAAALEDQKALADASEKTEITHQDMVQSYKDMARYGPRAVLITKMMSGLVKDINNTNVWKLASIRNFIRTLVP